MSRCSWVGLGLVLFFLQASVLPFFFQGVWQPDLWLTAIVLSALIHERHAVFMLALVGGLTQDIIIGNFFGLHLFPYMIVAFLGMWWGRERYNRQWSISMAAVMMGSLVYVLAAVAVIEAGGNGLAFSSYFLHRGIPLIMMNGTAALLMHGVFWGMKHERESKW